MKIFVAKSKKCRGKESLYFTIPRDLDLYELDCIHPKYYDIKTQAFETSLSNFPIIMDKFIDYDIQIEGDIPNKLENELIRLDRFDHTWNPIYKTTPYEYQREGVSYSHLAPKFLLGDQMGLRSW